MTQGDKKRLTPLDLRRPNIKQVQDMGELNLYVIQDNLKSLVWSHRGQSRKSKEDTPWEQVSLTFYPYADYEFVFEAISGSAYRSDIAIDNIVVSQNMCTLCEGDGLFDCQSSKSQLGLFTRTYFGHNSAIFRSSSGKIDI